MTRHERIVVLTGAGLSAESGLGTFRDVDGIWTKYDLADVATPEGIDLVIDPDVDIAVITELRETAEPTAEDGEGDEDPGEARPQLDLLLPQDADAQGVAQQAHQDRDRGHEDLHHVREFHRHHATRLKFAREPVSHFCGN